jgi:rifampicin phosphotransferase
MPMHPDHMLLRLSDAAARDPSRTGSKAATLASLLQAGFPVPDGMILTTRAFEAFSASESSPELRNALNLLASHYGCTSVAIRSSALAEDLPDATFAGQYETILNVLGSAAIKDAVHRCWASLNSPEASAYRQHMENVALDGMAVLVQPMVAPSAAGVALGADPITGSRSSALITAVRGLAEPLVSGKSIAEEWDVTASIATCRTVAPFGADVLTGDQAMAIGAMLRKAEALLDGPQDVEWAIADSQLLILQARPMSALPSVALWPAPRRGVWLRSIRLGEWLPEPLTPLFETWLLERLEMRFQLRQQEIGGFKAPPPLHVSVNGWYFHSPIGGGRQTVLLRGMLRRPRLAVATTLGSRRPAIADRLFFRAQAARWQRDVLVPYQRAVADGSDQVQTASAADLAHLVDRLADLAGDFFWSLVLFGGAAWRFEVALARFHHRYLRVKVSHPYQVLLSGLAVSETPSHAVYSLDWWRETIGRLTSTAGRPPKTATRREEALSERLAAEASCRKALEGQPRLLARFTNLLTLAQRYAAIRADHAEWFTLAWPVMRQGVRCLGGEMVADGLLDELDDIFFITHAELADYLAGGRPGQLSVRIRDRRAAWDRNRRLAPPLALGRPPLLLAKVLLSSPKVVRSVGAASDSTLHGTPASPGSAAGPARILRSLADADSVRPGDVLIVSAAVPALTLVFDRIAALCVDGGSVAAHASLIAREYGIPTVTGLGDATSRLSDDMWVFVDGTAGVVNVR